MATKEEEKKVLEQIRALVDSVGGADSYIGMAFEGCFELAEENIECDFGCSHLKEIESLRKKEQGLKQELESTKEFLSKQIIFTEDELRYLREIISRADDDARYSANLSQPDVLAYCMNPASPEFKKAASTYQNAKDTQEKCRILLKKL